MSGGVGLNEAMGRRDAKDVLGARWWRDRVNRVYGGL